VGGFRLLREHVLGVHRFGLSHASRLFLCEPKLLGRTGTHARVYRHRNVLQQAAIHPAALRSHARLLRPLARLLHHPLLGHRTMDLPKQPHTRTTLLGNHVLARLDHLKRRRLLLRTRPRMDPRTLHQGKTLTAIGIPGDARRIVRHGAKRRKIKEQQPILKHRRARTTHHDRHRWALRGRVGGAGEGGGSRRIEEEEEEEEKIDGELERRGWSSLEPTAHVEQLHPL